MVRAVELARLKVTSPVVLSIGVFDGVHLGHQHLLKKAVARARELRATSVALTFDPDPQAILSPATRSAYLTDLGERADLIGRLGIDRCAYLKFDVGLAHTSTESFIDLVLRHLAVIELWVGPDFALGSGRQGTIPILRDLGRQRGFTVHTVPPYTLAGEVVSSTAIRRLLAEGNVRGAGAMLGRCVDLRGSVIEGDKRGRQLGYPTANLAFDPARAIPADGVYAAFALLGSEPSDSADGGNGLGPAGRWHAVVSIGLRPTFAGDGRTIEAHLLDFSGSLYGRYLGLEFVEWLRPEQKFSEVRELVEQMGKDVAAARRILTRERCPELWAPAR